MASMMFNIISDTILFMAISPKRCLLSRLHLMQIISKIIGIKKYQINIDILCNNFIIALMRIY